MVRDWKLLRIFNEINAGKSADKIFAENDDLPWDVQYYINHPELQTELYTEIRKEVSRGISRIAQLSERISTRKSDDISSARKIGRDAYPETRDALFNLVPVFGPIFGGYNEGLGEGLVNSMREAGVDMRIEESIENFLGDQEALKTLVEKRAKMG